jgi:hypothetical protein
MRNLLLLAHLQSEKTPREQEMRQIVDLAGVCEKYKTAGVARDRVRIWMGPYLVNGVRSLDEAVDWAKIGWVFGHKDIFQQAVAYVLDTETPGTVAELDEKRFPTGVKGIL